MNNEFNTAETPVHAPLALDGACHPSAQNSNDAVTCDIRLEDRTRSLLAPPSKSAIIGSALPLGSSPIRYSAAFLYDLSALDGPSVVLSPAPSEYIGLLYEKVNADPVIVARGNDQLRVMKTAMEKACDLLQGWWAYTMWSATGKAPAGFGDSVNLWENTGTRDHSLEQLNKLSRYWKAVHIILRDIDALAEQIRTADEARDRKVQ